MKNLQKNTLFMTILFCCIYNIVSSQDIRNNYENDSKNKLTISYFQDSKINDECQTINDCSTGAIECRKDNKNENISYCIYPENDNIDPEAYFPINDTLINGPNQTSNSTVSSCSKDEDCPSNNKCISGQCQIDLKPLLVNIVPINEVLMNSDNTIQMNCTENENCSSKQCNSGQCQTGMESFTNRGEGEQCENDSQCVSSNCDKSSHRCTEKKNNNKNTVLAISLACGGLAIALTLSLIVIKKGLDKKSKKIKDEFKENVQQPMCIIYSADTSVNLSTYTY